MQHTLDVIAAKLWYSFPQPSGTKIKILLLLLNIQIINKYLFDELFLKLALISNLLTIISVNLVYVARDSS